MTDDNVLLNGCLSNEEWAWLEVRRMLFAFLYGVGRERCGLSPGDVPDVVQETLLALLADDMHPLRQFRGRSRLFTYLASIALNVCRTWLSRRRPSEASAEQYLLSAASGPAVNDALLSFWLVAEELLLPLDVQILRLDAEGYSAEEIASSLSTTSRLLTPNNVYVRKHRALRKLRAYFQSETGGDIGPE